MKKTSTFYRVFLILFIAGLFAYNKASAAITITNSSPANVITGSTFTLSVVMTNSANGGTMTAIFTDYNNVPIYNVSINNPVKNTPHTFTSNPITAPAPGTYTYHVTGSATLNITIIVLPLPPSISYTPSTNNYTVGTSVTLSPDNNGGGSVPAAKTYTTSTFASGFNGPRGIAIDASSNLYIADNANNQIKKITPGGVITVFAGSTGGTAGNNGGSATGTAARFNSPFDITIDPSGNLYVADQGNKSIRMITTPGAVVTNIATGINLPTSITYDNLTGALFVTTFTDNTILKVTTGGTVTTFAGAGGIGGIVNSTGTAAKFNDPNGIGSDASGNFYVADQQNNVIRKITTGAVVSTFATGFNTPRGITSDAFGNIYVTDNGSGSSDLIKLITPAGVVTTILGNATSGLVDGTGTAAEFNQPRNLAVDAIRGYIYVPDFGNNVIRKVAPSGYTVSPALPAGLSMDANTGIITGIPTAPIASTIYTITAINSGGSSTTTVNLSISLASPTISGGGAICLGSVLTASTVTPTGGIYTWYNSAGTQVASGTGNTYAPTTADTYFVTYSVSGFASAKSAGVAVTGISTTPPILSTAPATPAGSLYLSYPFSGNANDISGNNTGLVGTTEGSPALTTDRFGVANSAYNFNGTNQYVATTTPQNLTATSSFSLSIWFKTTSAKGSKLIGLGSSQTGPSGTFDRHIYMTDNGQLYFGVYAGITETINTTAHYNDGNWHHVVATFSGTNGSNLYVDGALQNNVFTNVASAAAMNTAQVYSPAYWRIGYDNTGGWNGTITGNYFFNGALDDVAVYNTELTASQVYSLYGAGSPATCVGNPLTLQANMVSGAASYSWTGPNGYSSGPLSNPNITVSSAATAAMAGTYTLTVANAGGCTSSINVTAVVNTIAAAQFSTTAPTGNNDVYTFTFSGTPSPTSTYSWDFDGGTILSGSGTGPYAVTWSTTGSKTVTLTTTNAGGCSGSFTQTFTVAQGNTSAFNNIYAFSRTVTFKSGTGALQTAIGNGNTLTNFPALLYITSADLKAPSTVDCTAAKVFKYNDPNKDYDFAFVDPATGAELNYEIESYNATLGTLLVWVQIPAVTNADHPLTFFYGSTAATHNTAFHRATWGADYLAVYHFKETPVSASASITDATTGHPGTPTGMTAASVAVGKIGNAYNFNGTTSKIAATALTTTGTSFTISAWVKLSALGIDQKIMTNEPGGANGAPLASKGFKLGVYTGTNPTINNVPETEGGGAVNRGEGTSAPSLNSTSWYYVQGVYDSGGNFLYTYVNGMQYQKLSETTNPVFTNPFFIGVGEGGTILYFNGLIDEPRVSNVAKTSNWLMAEYLNQSDSSVYTSVGTNLTVNTAIAAPVMGALTYTWAGTSSTDPTVASNWSNTTGGTSNQLPAFDGTANLVIPAGLSNYPALTADGSLYALTLASGASLNLNGHMLTVGCNIYNSSGGQILYGGNTASGLTWGGTAAQTYNGTNTAATAQIGTMTINNTAGVTITGGPIDVYTALNVPSGTLTVSSATGSALTLKSTATQTANVGQLTPGSVTGIVTVERYITGNNDLTYRGYRLLSSAVHVPGTGYYDISYLKGLPYPGTGSGSYLTGTGGGFDAVGGTTLFFYREDKVPTSNGNYQPVTDISQSPLYMVGSEGSFNLPIGNGIFYYYRGNNGTVSTTPPASLTFSSKGALNQGPIPVTLWFKGGTPGLSYSTTSGLTNVEGYNLVGNPYASSIDWNTAYGNTTPTTGIYAPNTDQAIYRYDVVRKNYDTYLNNGSPGGTGTNGITNIIPSGAGFLVHATSGAAQLIFNETAKVNAQVANGSGGGLLLNAYNPIIVDQHLRLQLVKDSINKDETIIIFNNTTSAAYVQNEDALYLKGTGAVNLSNTSTNNKALAISQIPFPKKSQAIPLTVNVTAAGVYQLKMTEAVNVPNLYDLWLMDAYMKDSLDMKHNPAYSFKVNSDTSSTGTARFSLVIRQNAAYSYHLLNFTGTKATGGAQLNWTTENEDTFTTFAVQRSTDGGKTFTTLSTIASTDAGAYSYLDTSPAAGEDQYRLQTTDINGAITNSNVVTLLYGSASTGTGAGNISIYPNPVNDVINLTITPTGKAATNYTINIISSNGNLLKTYTSQGVTWQSNISGLAPAVYVLKVINNTDKTVVGTAKFIKL